MQKLSNAILYKVSSLNNNNLKIKFLIYYNSYLLKMNNDQFKIRDSNSENNM